MSDNIHIFSQGCATRARKQGLWQWRWRTWRFPTNRLSRPVRLASDLCVCVCFVPCINCPVLIANCLRSSWNPWSNIMVSFEIWQESWGLCLTVSVSSKKSEFFIFFPLTEARRDELWREQRTWCPSDFWQKFWPHEGSVDVTHHICCQSTPKQAKLDDLDNAGSVIKSWRSRLHLRSLFSPFLHVKVFSFATRCTFDATCTSFKVKPLCRRKQRKLPRKLQQKLRLLQQRLRRPRMMKKKSAIFRTLLTKKTTLKAKNLSHEPDLSSSQFWVSWAGMGFFYSSWSHYVEEMQSLWHSRGITSYLQKRDRLERDLQNNYVLRRYGL